MSMQLREITLDLTPRARFDIIDVAARVSEQHGDVFQDYQKTLCCSLHTTAGYLEQRLCARLGHGKKQLDQFIRTFQKLFPPNAGYFHDCMRLRHELSASEKETEPINADSHLTFMSAGLKNCAIYVNTPKLPIYFIDLDGVYKHYRRTRHTTILAYNQEERVYHGRFSIPVPPEYPINSFNLKDPRYGLFDHLNDLIESYGIEKGRIDLRLVSDEHHVGLTVNEYETMLMRNDLSAVLRNPLRYMVQRGKQLLYNPASIPAKTRDYAVYDLIYLYNELMDNLQISRSAVDKALSYVSVPVSRIFRLKRQISLLISNSGKTGPGRIVQGTYQSPILLQYRSTQKGFRGLDITLWNFA
ncbi:hypothetical protein NKDENANG_02650 [Candidatus Entotheonellaceae bacterium PAL068K]